MTQKLHKLKDPFPHLIVENLYTEEELKLIWEELNFLTKPHKLRHPNEYGAATGSNGTHKTTAKALLLDEIYPIRETSNILTVIKKLFDCGYFKIFSQIAPHCKTALYQNKDITKLRYYQDGEEYLPHTDPAFDFMAFTYFYKEPKKFEGGELIFTEYGYEFYCPNNSVIIFPGYVEHAVNKIKLNEATSYTGNGRYCITQFTNHELK